MEVFPQQAHVVCTYDIATIVLPELFLYLEGCQEKFQLMLSLSLTQFIPQSSPHQTQLMRFVPRGRIYYKVVAMRSGDPAFISL